MATAASEEFEAYAARSHEAGRVCAICQTQFAEGEPIGSCPACAAIYHRECWAENGGCAAYGCDRMPTTVKSEERPSPQSYWGQDEKKCPKCAKTIKVAAVRCRFCGTTFETSAPITRREHKEKEARKEVHSKLKTASLWFFICGIVPCLAPFAAVIGGIWFMSNRKEIGKLPSINRVYCYAGLIASTLSTALMTVVMLLVVAAD